MRDISHDTSDRKDAMTPDDMEAICAALATIAAVSERIALVIDYENNLLLGDAQATAVLSNAAFQEKKTELYQRFEDITRIVCHMAERQTLVSDAKVKARVQAIIAQIEQMKRVVSINNLLLKAHIDRHRRLVEGIMGATAPDSMTQVKLHAEEPLCP